MRRAPSDDTPNQLPIPLPGLYSIQPSGKRKRRSSSRGPWLWEAGSGDYSCTFSRNTLRRISSIHRQLSDWYHLLGI